MLPITIPKKHWYKSRPHNNLRHTSDAPSECKLHLKDNSNLHVPQSDNRAQTRSWIDAALSVLYHPLY